MRMQSEPFSYAIVPPLFRNQIWRGSLIALALCVLPFCATGAEPSSDDETFFETKIRPVLATACIECHGPKKASGGLRLDSYTAILKGGDSGPAIELNQPEASLLVRAIGRSDDSLKMPPERPLSRAAVEDLTRWIASGAKWPASQPSTLVSEKSHWAFEALQSHEPPQDPSNWAQHPIDRFIAASRNRHSLTPVPTASKAALIRRAYFDLIGLPPTPENINQFEADDSPDAFERVIDGLLGSERYGERWGRHWLDLVRYADTAGDNADYPIPQAYLYRDYVIDAFNDDLPYDRFLHEQLAGDLLAKDSPESDYARLVTATGFIAQSKRIGTRELEDMHLIIEDTLTTLGPAIMGLSLRCARCHDHKFEPISMQDYYALYGFFASTQYPFAGAEEVRKQTKFAPLLPPHQVKQRLSEHDALKSALKLRIDELERSAVTAANKTETNVESAKESADSTQPSDTTALLKSLRDELASLEKIDPLAAVPTAYAVSELKPTDVAVQVGGNPHSSGPLTPRGVPKILDAQPLEISAEASGRLELARWMTTKASYLTSRVMVNRIWQYHFGKSLVPTPSDFGLRGTPPTHPELLDWLAEQFVAAGWSMKAMHRLIMLSKTYQLASQNDPHNAEVDSGNTWYWRFDRRRMDAESLRDSILMISGSLDLSRPGPHPFPKPEKWRYTAHHQFNDVAYPSDHRSVYLMVQRLHAHPYLSLFNGADASLSTPSRDISTVPLQALYLLNNQFVHDQSQRFAARLVSESNEFHSRLRTAILMAYGRQPLASDMSSWQKFVANYDQLLVSEGFDAAAREREIWSSLARTLLASNEFYFID